MGLENDFQGPSQVLQGLVEMARHSFRCLLLGQPQQDGGLTQLHFRINCPIKQ